MSFKFDYILDKFPTQINDLEFNYDFKTILIILKVFDSDKYPENEKIIYALKVFYGDQNLEGYDFKFLVEKMFDFINCYREKEFDDENDSNNFNMINDFIKNPYGFDSFLQLSTPINLNESNMHWFLFNAHIRTLPEHTNLSKIMHYRSINITDKMSVDERTFYAKMQAKYSLKPKLEDISEDPNYINFMKKYEEGLNRGS